MDPQAGLFAHGPQKSGGGALAIGARNMDDWRQSQMRIAQRMEQNPDAIE